MAKSIEINIVNGKPEKTLGEARTDQMIESIDNRGKAHKKLYDDSESWPGRRVLRASIGDLINMKRK